MSAYKSRIADEILKIKLQSKGAVLVQGTKWCGKTTTSEQLARSSLYMSDPITKQQNLMVAEIDPQKLLEGETPRLIDEWQLAPNLWDAVRFEVDHRGALGQFILTGSAVPPDKSEISHSGTGRFSWLTMRPMSLFESGESSGTVKLKDLFAEPEGLSVEKNEMYRLEDLAFLTCRGGWPLATDMRREIALLQARDYIDAVVNEDISRVDGVNRDSECARKIMRSYARLQGVQASLETVLADVKANDSTEMSRDMVSSYIKALRDLFVIEDAEAWNPNLRSKTAIRTTNTRYFVDPSIAAAALGATPESLMADLNLFGFLFETLCVRDLRVYADALDAKVYHYRDKRGLECDAVVVLRNGDFGLVEIKLGGESLIAEGVKRLNELSADLKTPPKFKMVLTGTEQYAYQRKEDGTFIVPVGCLAN